MTFKRIHVKGEEDVDLSRVLLDDPQAAFAGLVHG
jgi:2,5-furandicarboxylate decarboxylase 1